MEDTAKKSKDVHFNLSWHLEACKIKNECSSLELFDKERGNAAVVKDWPVSAVTIYGNVRRAPTGETLLPPGMLDALSLITFCGQFHKKCILFMLLK